MGLGMLALRTTNWKGSLGGVEHFADYE